jgi:hypothetical protein
MKTPFFAKPKNKQPSQNRQVPQKRGPSLMQRLVEGAFLRPASQTTNTTFSRAGLLSVRKGASNIPARGLLRSNAVAKRKPFKPTSTARMHSSAPKTFPQVQAKRRQ